MKIQVLYLTLAAVLPLAACGPKPNTEQDSQTSLPGAAVASSQSKSGTMAEELVNDNCGINAPAAGSEIDKTNALSVWGYALDKSHWSIPSVVSIRITALNSDEKVTALANRGPRPDVAAALNHPELVNTGFGAVVDVSSLPDGKYVVSVAQQVGDKLLVCNSELPITLK